ncbi:hypothetical protein LTR67_007208 [Exophiala xenobiotica]
MTSDTANNDMANGTKKGMGNRGVTTAQGKVSKPTQFETRLFINNEFVDASSKEFITVKNPFDESVVTNKLHSASDKDIDAAVAAARKAFKPWAAVRAQERSAILLRFADLVEQNANRVAALESICGGTALSFMKSIHVPFCVRTFRYYAGWCDEMEGESFPADNGYLRIVRHQPLGVCAAIIAFNGPAIMFAMKAAPALAAGNCLVVKPSEKSPLSTLYLAELAVEAGFPPGVLNVVNGTGSVGAAIAAHLDIQKLSFTGSVAVAKKIAALASGSNLKKVTFELGGKSPSIIFPDANLDVAIAWCTRSITDSSGQACVASSRVYVHQDIKKEFLRRFKESFESIHNTYGDPFDADKTNGPIVDRPQHERVLGLVESGKQQATLITGGSKLLESGCFVQPTIFADSLPDARVHREEIFGPVVVVNSFKDEDEVIATANDTDYGLSGAVFTQDINRAMRVAAQINSGTVGVNCCGMIDPQVPFGGFKQSGIGRELGKYGWLDYTETKTVYIK